jgi:hypothetical protein
MQEQIDAHGVFEGTARNAKAGAVVVVGGKPLYLDGLAAWPDGCDGMDVRVAGTLRRRKKIADPVCAGGQLSQGATGMQLVIEAPVWERR